MTEDTSWMPSDYDKIKRAVEPRTYDYQLFAVTGQYVTTVAGPPLVLGVVCWRDRYFAAREGRYVEVQVFRTEEKPR